MSYPIENVRAQFPILGERVHDKPLVYFDTAATALKPKRVVDLMYKQDLFRASNVHRGVHYFSDLATSAFELARSKIEKFIGCNPGEVVFTHGTTESINIVAQGFAKQLTKNDEILLTELEHHSNIVPWQLAAQSSGATVKWIPIDEEGEIDLEKYKELVSQRTKVVAFSGLSNTLGTKLPVKQMVEIAKSVGAKTLIDAAQLVTNDSINVKELGCDFLCFSGHKLFGPTGVGVLFGKKESLEALPPAYGGGAMISSVTFEGSKFLEAPFRFEAGTPHITGVIGLGESVDFVNSIGFDKIKMHEERLLAIATEDLSKIDGLKIIGQAQKKGPIVSFVVEGLHHQDIGSVLDQQGIAVRTGHHCTQPLLSKFGLTGTVRASFSVYTTEDEVRQLGPAIIKAKKLLG
jgi:cysteine desulfurase/selenocysteine lyase